MATESIVYPAILIVGIILIVYVIRYMQASIVMRGILLVVGVGLIVASLGMITFDMGLWGFA